MELLEARGGIVAYNDPYVPRLPPMRHHKICRDSRPLTEELLRSQDCIVIVTDHSAYQFDWIVNQSKLVVDTRNATNGIKSDSCCIWKA